MRTRAALVSVYAVALAVLGFLHPLRGLPATEQVGRWALTSPDAALTVLAGCLGWLIAAWVVLVLTLVAVVRCLPTHRTAGERVVRALVPRALRPLMHAAVGGTLLLGSAAPALAADLTPVPAPVVAAPEAPLPPLDWVTPVTPVTPAPAPPPVPTAASGQTVHQVVAGDTLWQLAADRLASTATPAEITAAWQEIYAANRTVVGPDPSFLLPGETLLLGRTA
jgi:nucleoid-associated protein YgaU